MNLNQSSNSHITYTISFIVPISIILFQSIIILFMSPIKFSTRKVRQTLLQLDTSKSKGPDGIPAIVLKICAPELAPILNKLFQISYTLGTFPTSWKQAHVFPIPKKGDKSNPLNYRPIAITSLISKTMETIITKQLLTFLETNNLLSDHQYGF